MATRYWHWLLNQKKPKTHNIVRGRCNLETCKHFIGRNFNAIQGQLDDRNGYMVVNGYTIYYTFFVYLNAYIFYLDPFIEKEVNGTTEHYFLRKNKTIIRRSEATQDELQYENAWAADYYGGMPYVRFFQVRGHQFTRDAYPDHIGLDNIEFVENIDDYVDSLSYFLSGITICVTYDDDYEYVDLKFDGSIRKFYWKYPLSRKIVSISYDDTDINDEYFGSVDGIGYNISAFDFSGADDFSEFSFNNAFSYKNFLEEVDLSNCTFENVTDISSMFNDCPKLRKIVFSKRATFASISSAESSFSEIKIASIKIPSGLTKIDDYMFFRCEYLEEVIIPDSVTTIGQHAFNGCGLYNFTIPDSVTSIGANAFKDVYKSSITNLTDFSGLPNYPFGAIDD